MKSKRSKEFCPMHDRLVEQMCEDLGFTKKKKTVAKTKKRK